MVVTPGALRVPALCSVLTVPNSSGAWSPEQSLSPDSSRLRSLHRPRRGWGSDDFGGSCEGGRRRANVGGVSGPSLSAGPLSTLSVHRHATSGHHSIPEDIP